MQRLLANAIRWLFDSRHGVQGRLIPRWIFLRALAAIYFSAFYSLLFQVKGLIGPEGILPAQHFLAAVADAMGAASYWYAPSLYWISASSGMLIAVTWIGLTASIAAFFNVWPRVGFLVCFVCFLSFVTVAGVFSGYQSDGMLLEAGFLALFFAPRGLMPGWGAQSPPSRASLFLLQWVWFRIYFESGMAKLLSGDPEWRHFTALDEYYQNGPLPTWIGWYMQHLPHWFQAATAGATLVLELGLLFMLFFPRRVRLICFCIVTPWQIGVTLTANYTFLNYLVLSLGFLLLDDRALMRFVPMQFRPEPVRKLETDVTEQAPSMGELQARRSWRERLEKHLNALGLAVSMLLLTWVAYDATAELIAMPLGGMSPVVGFPVRLLDPFRIANQYGLFAVMTRGRYEIEFQGSGDGNQWVAYPFRYKPQALNEPPRIYAPYQPRFDWNLWFASLGDWQQNDIVPLTEERLIVNDPDVLALFKRNPFPGSPPRYVRAVLWQYWFTTVAEKRQTGNWWRRRLIGLYAPELTTTPEGRFEVVGSPPLLPPHD